MKKYFYLLLALPLLLAACELEPAPTPEPEVKDPVLTLTSDGIMEFKAEGGTGVINFSVENAVEDAKVTATCEAEWVSDLAVAETITFTVAANESEARETIINVSYVEQSFEVAIKQEAKQIENPDPLPELKQAHTITIENVTWRDATIIIKPEDAAAEYVAAIMTKEAYDAKYGENKDAIITDRLDYWKATAKQYEDYGYDDPWQYYMQLEQRSDEQIVAASELLDLTWSSDYVVYCFGIDDEGNVTSAVTVAEFKTLAPETSANEFEIIVDNTTESSITFTVKTSNDDPYFVALQQTGYTDCYGPETDQPYEMMINDLVSTYPDNILAEKYIRQGTAQFESSQFLLSINSQREYKVIVCGFENGPTTEVILSEAIKPGSTTSEEPLTLELDVYEVAHDCFKFSVTPSAADRTYFVGTFYNELVGADVEAFIAELTLEPLYTGYLDLSIEAQPETECCIILFGYDAEKGERTTDVIYEVVTTLAEPVVDSDFEVAVSEITWHDASIDITAKDSSAQYIVGVLSKSDYTNKCYDIPANIAELRLAEWKEIAEMYQDWGYTDPWQYYMRNELKSGTRSFVGSQLCQMRWASDYVAYVFGMDNQGNLTSDVFVTEYTTLVPVASANGFEIKLNATTTSSVTFTVTTTNNDPYYVTVQQKSYVDAYGDGKEESYEDMIYNLTGEYADWKIAESIYSGTQTLTLSSLSSGKEYYIVVCGFENGPTTEISLSETFKAVAKDYTEPVTAESSFVGPTYGESSVEW